jgi:hypothetical protein
MRFTAEEQLANGLAGRFWLIYSLYICYSKAGRERFVKAAQRENRCVLCFGEVCDPLPIGIGFGSPMRDPWETPG